MSIEAALAELTAAVKANTEVTGNLLALRADAIETVKAAATPAAKPAAAAKPKADPAPAAEAPKEAPKTEAAAGTPQPTPAQAKIAEYLGGTEREEERKARTEKVKFLFGKVGATKASDIPEDKIPAILRALDTLIAAGDITAAETADEDLLAA